MSAAGSHGRCLASLRIMMLSGDWIPVALAGPHPRADPGCRLYSLGGATEASIWSIFHPIEKVDPEWVSIPYGKPLRNQTFHVLKRDLTPCPVHTTGKLFIGGVGLATGYWNDPEQTAARFVRHPRTGERLYDTGDLGRYRPDGAIEFLGREDQQVKLRGFRIELGEIEAALAKHPQVQNAVATDATPGETQRIVAYVVPQRKTRTRSRAWAFTLEQHGLPSIGTMLPSRLAGRCFDEARAAGVSCPPELPRLRRPRAHDGRAFGAWLGCLQAMPVENCAARQTPLPLGRQPLSRARLPAS